jgi:outer membrane lipoprotein-sorting protein
VEEIKRLKRRYLLGLLTGLLMALPTVGILGATSDAEPPPLSPDDVSTLTRVEEYLNRLETLQARFVQVSSNGAYAEGEIFIDRPGQLRFDYDPPHTALLISNGLTLLYYDRELKQASFIPLWETPLWFLVREKIKLDGDLMVTDIKEGLGTLSVTLQDRDRPESGVVTLIFSNSPLSLRKWEIVDAQGILTQVTLINPLYGGSIDPDLFDYGELDINNGQRKVDQ